MDVTGSGACVQRALDPPEPDVAGRGADVGGPADVAEPDVAARGFDLGVAADLVQVEVAGCRLCVQLAEPAPAAQVGRSGLGAHSRALGRANAQAHVELAQEAEAEAAPGLDQLLVNELLISLQNRERIDSILGRNIADGRQRIAFIEHAVQYHVDDTIAKLSINRLTVVPFTIHPV